MTAGEQNGNAYESLQPKIVVAGQQHPPSDLIGAGSTTQISVPQRQIPTETFCNFDFIASITKLIYEARTSLGIRLDHRAIKIDFKNERKYKDMIEENFQKWEGSKEEEDGDLEGEVTKRSSLAGDAEDQDEVPTMQSAIMLRRGRCGRLFAKYIQKSIFEDSDNGGGGLSDGETAEDIEKKVLLKKRRKRYQDLKEYLDLDGLGAGSEMMYQGLLLRD